MWSKKWYLKRNISCDVHLLNELLETDVGDYINYWRMNDQTFIMSLVKVSPYLLTPWSRVLLEKLTGSAASQEIPRIFGTRRFLTVPTSARHLSLS